MRKINIASAIILNNKKEFLTARKRGATHFMMIGGKVSNNETPLEALIRETKEEIGIDVSLYDKRLLGEHTSIAINEKDTQVTATIYTFTLPDINPKPHAEIEELKWLTLSNYKTIKLANLLTEFSLPWWLNQQKKR